MFVVLFVNHYESLEPILQNKSVKLRDTPLAFLYIAGPKANAVFFIQRVRSKLNGSMS